MENSRLETRAPRHRRAPDEGSSKKQGSSGWNPDDDVAVVSARRGVPVPYCLRFFASLCLCFLLLCCLRRMYPSSVTAGVLWNPVNCA